MTHSKSRLALTAAVSVALLAACASTHTPPATGAAGAALPTAPFRAEHAGIREHLGHTEAWTAELRTAPPADRTRIMRDIAGFYRGHIVPHAEWEERSLYPVVDRHAGSAAKHPFTASMRHEHGIVSRWTSELEAEAAKPAPDVETFARRAQSLAGLVTAHFEEEEEVLLPVLDAALTPEQFREEVLGGGGAHDAHSGH